MPQITVSGIDVDVVRKNIKNMHLAVYPPDGRVRVAVPLRINDEAVRLFVISKIAWIKRQRARFAGQERQAEREFVSGESHYFMGQRYRLEVVFGQTRQRVELSKKTRLYLYMKDGSTRIQREKVMTEWYRKELKAQIPPLIKKWQDLMGVEVNAWGAKRMKTKWGSCNTRDKRIWLNLELAKKPPHCLEYIIVHEMVHLLERKHNDRFMACMDRFMPQWRSHKEELNKLIFDNSGWEY